MAAGFVYVMSNPAMPGIVKIGVTEKSPAERASQLYSSGVPAPFRVEFAVWCENANRLEADMHDEFDQFRSNPGREFFEVDTDSAVERLVNNALSYAGVERRVVHEQARELLDVIGARFGQPLGIPVEVAAIDFLLEWSAASDEWFKSLASQRERRMARAADSHYQRTALHFMEGIS